MGGIYVDVNHRTRIRNLYAAGEAACQYHGANRLGANSLLGAIAGGRTAADAAMDDLHGKTSSFQPPSEWLAPACWLAGRKEGANLLSARKQLNLYLQKALGMERNETDLLRCLEQVGQMEAQIDGCYDAQAPVDENVIFPHSLLLAKAILHSALERKESRGAHTRSDCPGEREEYRKTTLSVYAGKAIRTVFQPIEGD